LKQINLNSNSNINSKSNLNSKEDINTEIKDEIKLMLMKFLKEKNVDSSVEIRKLNDNSYLVICSTQKEAKQIIGYTNDLFKLRLLNDSPSNIK